MSIPEIQPSEIPIFKEYDLPLDADDSDLPSYTCSAYHQMQPGWTLVEDVYAGTRRIRERRLDYLAQYPIESSDAYETRARAAVLMNFYARTVDAMTGLVIGSGLKTDNIPPEIDPHLKNIDNAGTEFEVFARDVMRDAFTGHCVVLIDMPDVPDDELPQNKTQKKKSKIRPYWTRHRPDEIPNWRPAVIDGEVVVAQITFRECVTVPVGEFGETDEVHYLRWYLATDTNGQPKAAFKKYVEVSDTVDVNGKATPVTKYRVVAEKVTHLDRIPMFVVYGDQTDGKLLESKPPLLDLAHKNIEHLQLDSDYKKGLAIAGLAIPTLKTDKSEEEIEKVFGWDMIMCIGENEEFDFKEANGNALPNKRQALEDIKQEMGVLGLSLIAERAGRNITATERILDSVQQSNQLMAIQASLLQGLRKGIEIHGEWLKLAPTATDEAVISLSLDWTELVRSAEHMRLLFDMAREDFLSTLTLIESAAKYGILPSYVTADDEVARLKAEGRVRQSSFMMKSTTTGIGVTSAGDGNSTPTPAQGSSTSMETTSPSGATSTGD